MCNDLPYKGLIRDLGVLPRFAETGNDLPYKGLILSTVDAMHPLVIICNDLPYKGLIRRK